MTSRFERGIEYLGKSQVWLGSGKFDLSKVRRILDYFGDPQDRLAIVHVAGTNGKGSTSAAIASILGASGFTVGLNISPHLSAINERIVIDGRSVNDQWLGGFSYEIGRAATRLVEKLSMHEVVTCAAFLGFHENRIERAVFEVGLGGRDDASNVIKTPLIGCITSIDLDHQQLLGGTIESISRHKAGISKSGMKLVLGPLTKLADKEISAIAISRGSQVHRYGIDFIGKNTTNYQTDKLQFEISGPSLISNHEPFVSQLSGEHQVQNLALAAYSTSLLGASAGQQREGISQVFWPARFERFVYQGKIIILDCAHNLAGIRALISTLDSYGITELEVGFGVLDSKQWREMLALLAPRVRRWSLLLPNSSTALSTDKLAEEVRRYRRPCEVYGADYSRYISEIESFAGQTVLICGSIYLLGVLREYFSRPPLKIWEKKLIE